MSLPESLAPAGRVFQSLPTSATRLAVLNCRGMSCRSKAGAALCQESVLVSSVWPRALRSLQADSRFCAFWRALRHQSGRTRRSGLILIFGPPGVGKSRCIRQALGRKVCWIGGQATPFGIYLQAYEHRHQPIVLDDVDGLYADRHGIRLLKALGQTEGTKTLSWLGEQHLRLAPILNQLAKLRAPLVQGLVEERPIAVIQEIKDHVSGRHGAGQELDLQRLAGLIAGQEQSEFWLTRAEHNHLAIQDRAGRQLSQAGQFRILLGNDWKTLNADVAALEDRGHLLLCEPTPLEVHRQAARWFWDQEIFDFVADHLHLMAQHSLRTYRHAWELKQAGLDWRQGVLCRCLTGAALEVARLKANPDFTSEAERVRAFVQSGAGCRASYFRHARKLRPLAGRPKIALTHATPPADALPPSDHLDRLRRRFGRLGNG